MAGPASQQDVMEEHSVSGATTTRCHLTSAHTISWGLQSPIVPDPSCPRDPTPAGWRGRHGPSRMRDDVRARQLSGPPHKLNVPTLSHPEEEAGSRRRRRRRKGDSREKSPGPCPPHTEADAAGVARPPLPPRLRQLFIFNPVGSEMLSHSTTSYQSQIISITCLLTLAATQLAAHKK